VGLFDPGSGSQVHDLNGGVLASGLRWTLPVDDGLRVSHDGRKAVLDVKDIEVIDSFTFGSGLGTPATLSYRIERRPTGPFVDRGKRTAVPRTDPAAASRASPPRDRPPSSPAPSSGSASRRPRA
jgi:hypothetical protein